MNIAFEKRKKIGRGINLGNALDFGDRPWDGGQLYTWVIQKEDITRVRDAGFDSVRIPISWTLNCTVNQPYTVNPRFLNRVEQVINWALDEGLTVIANDHHHREMMKNPVKEFPRFLAIWEQVACYFKSFPDSLYWEILNEPCDNLTASIWNDISNQCLSLFRSIDPERTLLTTSVNFGSWRCLDDLVLPKDTSNIIVAVHYYEPLGFTHQGAYWCDPKHPLGYNWEGTDTELAEIDNMLDFIKNWEKENNCPIYMGEFGVILLADPKSRERYLNYLCRSMEKREITWHIWDFYGDFKVYDKENGHWIDNMLEILLKKKE